MNKIIEIETASKYFIYCRKSSDSEDKQIASLPDQIKVMTEFAKKNELKTVDVLTESKSAFKPGRPVFNEMLKRLEKGEADGVLSWDPSRIARNSLDSGMFIYLMDKGVLKELKTSQKTFYSTSNDKMSLNIEFTMSKKSSDDLSVNVHRGNRNKFFELKEWGGVAKPGYLNYTDSMTKENHIKTDPDRFSMIQKAIFRILDGTHTPMESLRALNNEGYLTRKTAKLGGRPLSKASFYRILSDPYYCGTMKRIIDGNCELGESHHQSMISEDQFDLLQIRLGKKGKPRYGKNDFPYKGLLQCGECTGSVTCEEKWQIICPICKTKFHRGRKTDGCPNCQTKIEDMADPKILHYMYYHCTKRVHKNCSQESVSLEKLEGKIDSTIQEFEIDKDYFNFAVDHLGELNLIEEQDQTEARERFNKRLDEIKWNLRNLVKLRIRGENINEEINNEKQRIYDEEENKLISEQKEINGKVNNLSQQQEKSVELTKETFDFAYYARGNFTTGDDPTKEKIASKLGSNLTIKDKELRIDGDYSFFLIKKGKEEIKEIINSLEPEKRPKSSKEALVIDSVCQSWRRRRDSNSRCLTTHTLSKRAH